MDILYRKTNDEYQKIADLIDSLSLQIKDAELTKLSLEKQKLEAEMRLRELEEEILKQMMVIHKPQRKEIR